MSAVVERPAAPAFQPGRFDGMPSADYHRIEAVGSGGVKKLLQSAAHYLVERTQPKEPTDEMQFGTAVHMGVLEPELFSNAVAHVPADAPKRPTKTQLNAKKPSPETLFQIDWWERFDDDHRMCEIVLAADNYDRCCRTVDAILAHPGAQKLLTGGTPEVSLFWNDARYGAPCKARIDFLRDDGGMVDIKTTIDASPEGFGRIIASFLYHVQGAHYWSGGEHVLGASPKFFAFIAAEKEPPYGVSTQVLQVDALRVGMAKADRALKKYAEAVATGRWTAYSDLIEPAILPAWALREAIIL